MTHVTCRLTAKNRDQLRNPTLGNREWASFTFLYTGWTKKAGPQTHDHYSVKSQPIKKNFTGRFFGKFAVKWVLKISPHLAYVGTLSCETLISAKQATNDKLHVQGVVGLLMTKLRKIYC